MKTKYLVSMLLALILVVSGLSAVYAIEKPSVNKKAHISSKMVKTKVNAGNKKANTVSHTKKASKTNVKANVNCKSCPNGIVDPAKCKACPKMNAPKPPKPAAGCVGGMCPVNVPKAKASNNHKVQSAICPVMGNKIPDITKAAGKSVYKGKTYYFCCKACKPMFDANPGKYVNKLHK